MNPTFGLPLNTHRKIIVDNTQTEYTLKKLTKEQQSFLENQNVIGSNRDSDSDDDDDDDDEMNDIDNDKYKDETDYKRAQRLTNIKERYVNFNRYVIAHAPPDGNCFFHSIIQSYNNVKNEKYPGSHSDLRLDSCCLLYVLMFTKQSYRRHLEELGVDLIGILKTPGEMLKIVFDVAEQQFKENKENKGKITLTNSNILEHLEYSPGCLMNALCQCPVVWEIVEWMYSNSSKTLTLDQVITDDIKQVYVYDRIFTKEQRREIRSKNIEAIRELLSKHIAPIATMLKQYIISAVVPGTFMEVFPFSYVITIGLNVVMKVAVSYTTGNGLNKKNTIAWLGLKIYPKYINLDDKAFDTYKKSRNSLDKIRIIHWGNSAQHYDSLIPKLRISSASSSVSSSSSSNKKLVDEVNTHFFVENKITPLTTKLQQHYPDYKNQKISRIDVEFRNITESTKTLKLETKIVPSFVSVRDPSIINGKNVWPTNLLITENSNNTNDNVEDKLKTIEDNESIALYAHDLKLNKKCSLGYFQQIWIHKSDSNSKYYVFKLLNSHKPIFSNIELIPGINEETDLLPITFLEKSSSENTEKTTKNNGTLKFEIKRYMLSLDSSEWALKRFENFDIEVYQLDIFLTKDDKAQNYKLRRTRIGFKRHGEKENCFFGVKTNRETSTSEQPYTYEGQHTGSDNIKIYKPCFLLMKLSHFQKSSPVIVNSNINFTNNNNNEDSDDIWMTILETLTKL